LSENNNKPEFPLGLQIWMELCERLNKNGRYVWTLLYENGVCIGVKKLFDRSQVRGFVKEYGAFISGSNIGAIGIYTESGIEKESAAGKRVERMDLSGTKKQY
jgi:uncharacterized membrane protein